MTELLLLPFLWVSTITNILLSFAWSSDIGRNLFMKLLFSALAIASLILLLEQYGVTVLSINQSH